MAYFWLSYRAAGKLGGVVIAEAECLAYARLQVSLRDVDTDMTYIAGHELDAERAALVAPTEVGRMMTPAEAQRITRRFDEKAPPRVNRRAGLRA